MISTPIFLLVLLYLQESKNTKIQADEFQRLALFKEILSRYGNDESLRNELFKHYLTQGTPLEELRLGTDGNDFLTMPLSSATVKGAINKTIEKLSAYGID